MGERGFVPAAMLAISNTIERMVSGYRSDRIGCTRTMVLAFVIRPPADKAGSGR